MDEAWIAPVMSAATALDGILAAFKGIVSRVTQRGRVSGCPLNNLAIELSLADAEFQHAVQAIFDGWQAAIAAKLRADTDAGILKNVDPQVMAAFVVASDSGAMAIAKANQSAEPLKTCARQLAALLQPHQQGPSISQRTEAQPDRAPPGALMSAAGAARSRSPSVRQR